MTEALRDAGVRHHHVVRLDQRNPVRQMQTLSAERQDFIFVWGGDGTHRTALNAIGREPSNLVLLPGGVRNLLSRSLHGTGDWKQVLRDVLRSPKSRTVAGGLIGDEFFFCALLAGAPALFASAREGVRDGDLFGALNAASRGVWAIENMQLHIRIGGQPAAAFGPPLQTSFVSALVGLMAANARMEVVTLKKPNLYTGLDVVWSSFQSGFRGNEDVTIAPAEGFAVEHSAAEDIPAVADGEPLTVGRQFSVQFVEHAAHALIAG